MWGTTRASTWSWRRGTGSCGGFCSSTAAVVSAHAFVIDRGRSSPALIACLELDLDVHFLAAAQHRDIHLISGLLGGEQGHPLFYVGDGLSVPLDHAVADLDAGIRRGCPLVDITHFHSGLVIGVAGRRGVKVQRPGICAASASASRRPAKTMTSPEW